MSFCATSACIWPLRDSAIEDLERISEAWRVPVASVAWAMVHTELQRCRKLAPDLGEHGLAIAAAANALGFWDLVELRERSKGEGTEGGGEDDDGGPSEE